MTTAYSTLMGLALPVQGELSGTWGDTVNKGITDYVDIALAGTQTISGSQTAVTLSLTNGDASATNIAQAGSGATGSAQFAIINCTGNPAGLLTVTVPASSRQYVVINATSTSQSVKIVGAGPTTGVTIVSGEKAHIAWNGSDYVKVSSSLGSGDVVGPASATDSALAAFDGTTGKLIKQAATVTVAQGGTGTTSLTANNVILGNGTSAVQFVAPGTNGNILTSNGTTWTSATPTSSMVYPGAGIAVSTGSAWGTSKTSPTGDIVGTTDSQTLTNKTIEAGTFTNGYTEETVSANTGTSYTINLANGSVQILTLTGNCTFTFPTATAGRSFLLMLRQDGTGSRTATWPASVKWPNGNTPTITSTASKQDILSFVADGTNWYGVSGGQNYTV